MVKVPRVIFVCRHGYGASRMQMVEFRDFLEKRGLDRRIELCQTGIGGSRFSREEIANGDHVVGMYADVMGDLKQLLKEYKSPATLHEYNTYYPDKEWKEKLLAKILPNGVATKGKKDRA